MRYWNNFWDNLKVLWNKHDLSDNKTLRNFGIEREMDNNNETYSEIKLKNLKNPNIDEIDNILKNLSRDVNTDKWHKDEGCDITSLEDTIYDILYPKTTSPKQISKEVNIIKSLNNNTETKNKEPLKQSEPHHLSQQDILIFCGSLLEMLKNGTVPFSSKKEKMQYLRTFFELKNQIANIESILLLREILNRTKPTEKNKENNNEDNGNLEGNKLSANEQKLEIDKLCDEIYSAFESSVKEYKDLELEIKKEYLDINKDKKISNIDELSTTFDKIQTEHKEICQLISQREQTQMLNSIPAINKQQNQGNTQPLPDLYKKQQKLAKLCDKVKLANIFNDYIYYQIANFADTFYYNTNRKCTNNTFESEKKCGVANEICIRNLQKMLKIIKGTEISNTNIIERICNILSQEDQNQINSIVNDNNDVNKNNINDKIDKINEDNNVDDSVSFYKRPSCFLDSICCSICTDEPVLYSAKDINSKEDLYREPKIQKKDKNDEQKLINFNTNIPMSKKDNINNNNISLQFYGEEGTLVNNNNHNSFSLNDNKSHILHEGMSENI